jgi:mannose-6-phosphate isomerase
MRAKGGVAPVGGGPIFFERNRVFRVYRGGKLFHDFFGDPAEDGFFPEEWIASTVRALNKEPHGEHEGLSIVRDSGEPFDTFMARDRQALLGARPSFDLLVKVLDSAIRLPVQAHPDKQFARRHLGSPHGKAEMWLVLATRPGARIYFGFRDGVTRRDFESAIRSSDTDRQALPGLLNELPAAAGEVYFIPARVAHAIGPGCLILEVQEPTDFTIQPEAWCGDYHLSEGEKYLGLPEETALECFDLENLVGARAVAAGRKTPRPLQPSGSTIGERLIAEEDTTDFAVDRYRIGSGAADCGAGPAVYVVTGGPGAIHGKAGGRAVRRGDYFFLPANAAPASFSTESGIEIVRCLPPASLPPVVDAVHGPCRVVRNQE